MNSGSSFDDGVVAGREDVAVEAGGDRLVCDDDGGRPALRPRLLLERSDAEDMVDVAVGEDRRVQPTCGACRLPTAQAGVYLPGARGMTGVDEHEPVVGGEGAHASEGRQVGDPVRHLGERPVRGERVVGGDVRFAAPESVRQVEDVGHPATVPSCPASGVGFGGPGRRRPKRPAFT